MANVTFGEPRFKKPEKTTIICVKKPTKYPDNYGNCGYYKWRFENFLGRHKTCRHIPPTYYFGPMQIKSSVPYVGNKIDKGKDWWSKVLNTEPLKPPYPEYNKGTPIIRESYGYKYCVVFSNYLMPKLSPEGQKWLKLARIYLQQYMEQGLITEMYISKYNKKFNKDVKVKTLKDVELNDSWFKEFAFATHPDAYLDAGLLNISIADKMEVCLTPDFKEWATIATWEQAYYVGKEQIIKWKDDSIGFGKEKYNEAKKYLEKKKAEIEKSSNEISEKLEQSIKKIESWF
jgi:hypothetical protein